MVRLRANEVVDDRVLLARAQAEIKRLKRRLREALEGTLLGVAEDHHDGRDADEVSSDGHQPEVGGGSDGTRNTSIGALAGCTGKPGGKGTQGREGGAGNAGINTAGTNSGGQPRCVSAGEGEEKTAHVSAAAASAAAAVEITRKRQTAKLIAENERLREDNDRLRADVERLVLQSKKQRLRRQRRQQRSIGRAGGIPTGASSAPFEWATRYAADARRRTPESSHVANSHARVNRSASSSRVVTIARKRRVSPTTAPARVPSLPKFRRRQFGTDGDVAEGAESGGEPVEDGLSAEEVRAIIGGNVEAEVAKTMLGLPGNQEEADEEAAAAAKQLEMFRRELQEGTVRGSFVQRSGGEEGVGAEVANNRIVAGRDSAAGSGNQEEDTDIEMFLEKSQRLEDLMFEAHGRERRRLREERGHLASAREQRLKLERQLADLTGETTIIDGTDTDTRVPANISTVKPAVTTNKNHVHRLPVDPDMIPTSAEGRDQPEGSKAWKQQQPPPPYFDGAISAPDEKRTTAAPSSILGIVGRNKVSNSQQYICSGDRGTKIGWAEQSSTSTAGATPPVATAPTSATATPATTAATTAMMMAVLAPPELSGGNVSGAPGLDRRGGHASNNPALGARRTVPATKLSQERRRQQAERVFPAATPVSLPNSSPTPRSRQRRPATSTGGPPTGSNRARSRSRRTQLRAGRVSRSPVRGERLAFKEPSSPQKGRNGGGGSIGQEGTKRGLAYGVADLGLRLKV